MTAPTPEDMRALADRGDSAGSFEVNETTIVQEMVNGLYAAGREMARLRYSVRNAPHEPWCVVGMLDDRACSCWKANAL